MNKEYLPSKNFLKKVILIIAVILVAIILNKIAPINTQKDSKTRTTYQPKKTEVKKRVLSFQTYTDNFYTVKKRVSSFQTYTDNFYTVKKYFMGYNGANLGETLQKSDGEVFRLLDQLNPSVVRFPGGTVANFYHPGKNGYGLREKDMKLISSDNEVYEMIMRRIEHQKNSNEKDYLVAVSNFLKGRNTKVMLVANLFSGKPEETLEMIRTFKNNGIEIVGVELGNELYLKAYRKTIISETEYLKRAKQFSTRIKAEFPDVKVAAIIAPSESSETTTSYFVNWNNAISQNNFYDALVVHTYPDLFKDKSSSMKTSLSAVDNYLSKNFPQIISEHKRQFGNNIPIWLTEWNLKNNKDLLNDVYIQNYFVNKFIQSLIKINSENNNYIQYALYHNLASGSDDYALIVSANNPRSSASVAISYNIFNFYKQIFNSGCRIMSQIQNDPLLAICENEIKVIATNNSSSEVPHPKLPEKLFNDYEIKSIESIQSGNPFVRGSNKTNTSITGQKEFNLPPFSINFLVYKKK